MKALPWLLVGSLVANAALVGVVVKYRSDSRVSAEAARVVSDAARVVEPAKSAQGEADAARSKALLESGGALFRDQQLSFTGSDLKAFAERLKAAGFPPNAVRGMITGLIDERMRSRREELQNDMVNMFGQYWSGRRNFGFPPNKEYMAKSRALNDERKQLLVDVLGHEANSDFNFMVAAQFSHLPPGKAERAHQILRDYQDIRSEIMATSQGIMLKEDREKLVFLEKEQRADLEQLMSPGELFEYEVRTSQTSNMLRSRIGTFEVSEEEFRTMFKQIRDAMGATSFGLGGNAGSEYQRFDAALKEVARTVLPPDRLAEFQQATDPQYAQINRLVARLDLPASAAREVVTVQQETLKQMGELRSNTALTAEQRNARLNALAEAAKQRVSTALGGARGLEAYMENGGQWLQRVAQPGAATPATQLPRALPQIGR